MRSENGETTMTAIATITHDERALLLRMERCRRDVRHGAVQLRAGLLWPERLRRVSGGGRRRSGGQFLGRGAEGVSHVLGLSEGLSKLIAIDKQPNHQIVHLFRLR